jgi:ABC-type transport system substrate-binding protein
MDSSYWNKITQQRIARRRLLRTGASLSAGAVALALVGCGDDDDDDGDGGGDGGGGGGGGGETPVPGGTLRHGMVSDLTALEPHIIAGDLDTLWNVWDKLTEYDLNFELQGRLAESWEVNDDSTEFIFHLRSGLQYHNGNAFKSEDVKYNITRTADPDFAFGQLGTMARWFETIETPDEQTIVLGSPSPRPGSFDLFEHLNIADPTSIPAADPTEAIGTGPYMLGEWRPGDQFNLLKNPNYWDEGRPYIDEHVYHVQLEAQTMVQQFEAGALDIARFPPVRDFKRLRDEGKQAMLQSTSGGYYVVGWNTLQEPTDDKRVRQAFNTAINRKAFAEVVLLDIVEPFCLPWPKPSAAYEEDKVNFYEFDLDKARSMFDEAGVGTLNTGLLLSTVAPEIVEFGEIMQSDLGKIDINMEIHVLELAAWIDKVNADPPDFNGMWSLNSGRANLGSPVNHFILQVTWSKDINKDLPEYKGRPVGNNNTGYWSQEYADLIDALVVESDPEKAKEMYSQLNDLILEDSWLGMLAPKPPRQVMQENVRGVRDFGVREGFEIRDAWIAT